MTPSSEGRYVYLSALHEPGRWSIFDMRNSLAGRLVRPMGWPGWSVADEEEAEAKYREMNEGGPLVARVRDLLQKTVGGDLNDEAVRYTASYFVVLLSHEPPKPVEEIVVTPMVQVAYGAILVGMGKLPPLVDDSAAPPLRAGPPLAEALKQGVGWLATEQVDEAVASHHGISYIGPWDGRIRMSVFPGPTSVDQWPVVVFESENHGHPFTAAEFTALEAATVAAAPVVRHWNGVGCSSVSFAISADVAASLRAALARYHCGCPTHGSVFCGQQEGCTWLRDGQALVVRPDGWY